MCWGVGGGFHQGELVGFGERGGSKGFFQVLAWGCVVEEQRGEDWEERSTETELLAGGSVPGTCQICPFRG